MKNKFFAISFLKLSYLIPSGIVLIFSSNLKAQQSECQMLLSNVEREMNKAQEAINKAREYLTTAQNYQRERLAMPLPEANTPQVREWRSLLGYENSYFNLAAKQYEEASKVYSDPGKSTWWRKNKHHKTWFDSDLNELLEKRECFNESLTHEGRLMSYHYRAQLISRQTENELTQWYRLSTSYRKQGAATEATELRRLNPERVDWCYDFAKNLAHQKLLDNFCGNFDGIGYRYPMRFIICKSNLNYFGFQNQQTTTYVDIKTLNGMVTHFFQVCTNEHYLEQMTRNEQFRTCMQNQARILQQAPQSAERCMNDLNISTRADAPRSATPEPFEADANPSAPLASPN